MNYNKSLLFQERSQLTISTYKCKPSAHCCNIFIVEKSLFFWSPCATNQKTQICLLKHIAILPNDVSLLYFIFYLQKSLPIVATANHRFSQIQFSSFRFTEARPTEDPVFMFNTGHVTNPSYKMKANLRSNTITLSLSRTTLFQKSRAELIYVNVLLNLNLRYKSRANITMAILTLYFAKSDNLVNLDQK